MAGLDVREYLEGLDGQTFPPLLLEILLKSGQSHFLKNVFRPAPDREMAVVRIWDLRAVDVSSLPEKLNQVASRDEWENFTKIDPQLDQANLWIHLGEIAGFLEWHERFWPERAEERGPAPIGFIGGQGGN